MSKISLLGVLKLGVFKILTDHAGAEAHEEILPVSPRRSAHGLNKIIKICLCSNQSTIL
jgi:hypothetical protein